jgi:hypothetical protein
MNTCINTLDTNATFRIMKHKEYDNSMQWCLHALESVISTLMSIVLLLATKGLGSTIRMLVYQW